ncbi:MAG: hypothetical protein JHC98_01810 [Thermoleophilaceae bacterium]|nr:hypothetical protein [Thermoleophilaceae bacterium]
MKPRHLIAFAVSILTVLALASTAGAASSGVFKVSASGKQSITWSLNGTRGSCEIQTGTGSGSTNFSFKTAKAGLLSVSRSGMLGSLTTSAKGSQSGSFVETHTACPPFEVVPPYTQDASGCGARKFDVRMDFATKKGVTWVIGPAQPLPLGSCPSYTDQLLSTDLTSCGDSNTQYKRSFGLAYGGIGLFASKLNISMKSLLKVRKGKKKTITGKTTVDCKPASVYSNPLVLKGELKYTLTFKRTG